MPPIANEQANANAKPRRRLPERFGKLTIWTRMHALAAEVRRNAWSRVDVDLSLEALSSIAETELVIVDNKTISTAVSRGMRGTAIVGDMEFYKVKQGKGSPLDVLVGKAYDYGSYFPVSKHLNR